MLFASTTMGVLAIETSDAYAAGPSAAERETARRLMDEGKTRMKEKEYPRAVDAFQKAHDLMHVPTTGLALAKAHLAAGHLVEARDAALEAARHPHEADEPAVFNQARKHARELDKELKPRIPTIKIKVKGANVSRITVDDIEIPATIVGEPVAVNPGKRVVSAKNGDGGEAKAEVEIAEKESKEVELVVPEGGPAAKTATKPSPVTPPPATTTAPSSSNAPKLRGFGNDDVDHDHGERTPVAEGLLYGGIVLGGVGLAVGAITGAMTLSSAGDVKPQCENNICAPEAQNDLDSATTTSTISTIAFIAGGVGVAVAVIGFVLPKKPVTVTRKADAAPKAFTFGLSAHGVGGTF